MDKIVKKMLCKYCHCNISYELNHDLIKLQATCTCESLYLCIFYEWRRRRAILNQRLKIFTSPSRVSCAFELHTLPII